MYHTVVCIASLFWSNYRLISFINPYLPFFLFFQNINNNKKDEPTTGLDSTAATSIIDTLRNLATNYNKTIVAVIHQPTQTVFSSFDQLLLISNGKQLYYGKTTNVRNYMMKYDNEPESDIGTAEYVLDCISNEPRTINETDEDAMARIDHLATIAKIHNQVDLGFDNTEGEENNKKVLLRFHGNEGQRANLLVQFKLLFKRSIGEVFRGKAKLILSTVQQVMLAVIYGGIYTIGTNQVMFFIALKDAVASCLSMRVSRLLGWWLLHFLLTNIACHFPRSFDLHSCLHFRTLSF